MKKVVLFLLATSIVLRVTAQSQAETFIKEAQDFLAKKEYKQAQLSLQDAINDINMMLAKQVSESLPAEINGLKAEGEGEVSAAGMGMIGGGMQITKRYRNETKTENDAEVQIIANSPLLSTMNMYLTNPTMLGPDYKSVRVGTNRAILKTEMQDSDNKKIRSTEIQIPLGQTLITIHANGFATEQDELAFATKLDLPKIKTALGE
ncbi:MAG TPA: hypothetical protein PK228_20215 [Saprospiraceae bacterium]|nr:hypothetical protein [Saprospiraceae bacterium]